MHHALSIQESSISYCSKKVEQIVQECHTSAHTFQPKIFQSMSGTSGNKTMVAGMSY